MEKAVKAADVGGVREPMGVAGVMVPPMDSTSSNEQEKTGIRLVARRGNGSRTDSAWIRRQMSGRLCAGRFLLFMSDLLTVLRQCQRDSLISEFQIEPSRVRK